MHHNLDSKEDSRYCQLKHLGGQEGILQENTFKILIYSSGGNGQMGGVCNKNMIEVFQVMKNLEMVNYKPLAKSWSVQTWGNNLSLKEAGTQEIRGSTTSQSRECIYENYYPQWAYRLKTQTRYRKDSDPQTP